MRRIDFYVQHLVKHNAKAIRMVSGQPVRFSFPTGDRRSNQPMEHGQLTKLIEEVASPEALGELARGQRAVFTHAANGLEVAVGVQPRGPADWLVELRPAGTGEPLGEEAAGGGRAPVAPPPPPQAPPSPRGNGAPRRGGAILDQDAASLLPPADGGGESPSRPPRSPRSFAPPPDSSKPEVQKIVLAPGEPQVNRFLRMMSAFGASDLHLSSGTRPMMRLHGEVQTLDGEEPLAPDELEKLLRDIMPERNIKEFHDTRDTDFAHTIEDLSRFRVNVFEDRKGVGAVFRMIPFEILAPTKLGLPPAVMELCWLSKGLVVVTGPTGSGKSTTLASLVDYMNDNRTDHIITIEDPIEFVHDNKRCLVNQREVGTHTMGFKKALRAALREDPDIVLVGEMRDLETIAIAIETAETGHLVFGTLHTTTAPSTVDRIIDQFPPDQQAQIRVMLSESLRGVIAQVLCKKKGGGRVAAFEILISTPAVANLIREGKTFQLPSILQTGKNLGMQTMTDHLFKLVKDGIVEPEEAYIKANDKATLKDMFKKNNIPLNLTT